MTANTVVNQKVFHFFKDMNSYKKYNELWFLFHLFHTEITQPAETGTKIRTPKISIMLCDVRFFDLAQNNTVNRTVWI